MKRNKYMWNWLGQTLATIYRGYILSYLWLWFVAQPFDIKAIGVAHGIGLSILMHMLTYQIFLKDIIEENVIPEAKRNLMNLGVSIFLSTTALITGFLTKLFM
jgi:hypothetical protein